MTPPAPKTRPVQPRRKTLQKALTRKKAGSTSLTASDPLVQKYFQEVLKYPLISREEEHDLAIRYRDHGDREAFQRLVTSNLRFVVKIAYEYIHYRMKLIDLIQDGNMGLLKAVREFDPYKEVRLTTYAVWWIRSYIQDAILRNYALVKVGTTQGQKKMFYRLRAEQRKLDQLGLSPSQNVKLLAEKFDVTEKEVREMDQRMTSPEVSLNAPLSGRGADGSQKQHLDNLADPVTPADEALGNLEQAENFKKVLDEFGTTLEGRDKVIFRDRLLSETPVTLQEIGDRYSISKERARQLEEQIKTKLKTYMEAHFPDYKILSGGTGRKAHA